MSHPFTEADVFNAVQTETPRDHFLVCGLGSLGQYCVAKLKEFGVSVSAIDIALPSIWEISNIPDLLEELVVGDCRQPDILARANIQQCQAVLIVTSNERVNIDTAFAVRVLNQYVRLVIRSSKQNLNEFLDRSLGNFEALEATQLTVSAFAIAALGNEIQGLINLNEHMLSVVKCQITTNHRWCDRLVVLQTINSLQRLERGEILPRRWQVQIDTAPTRDAVFEGARILARISGCGISAATKLMNNLPGVLLTPLYKFQAQRLVREFNKVQIKAHLISFPQTGGSDGRSP